VPASADNISSMTTVDLPEPVTTVDALGLHCPLPITELAKAIDEVAVGEDVVVIADDPSTRIDVPVWCRMRRQELIGVEELDAYWRYRVRRVA